MILSIVGENKLYKSLEEISDLLKQIQRNRSRILSIDFSGNVFEPEPMEALFEEISHMKRLRSAVLVGVFATLPNDKMLRCLTILSRHLPTDKLEILDLSDNALSCNLPNAFREFIQRLGNLRVLKLNNCGLGELGGNWLADTLCGVKDKNNLESIEIAQNKFINFPQKLGVALEKFIYLEEIRIQYNTIDQDSMDSFLKCFENHSLRVLDIRDNFLSLNGCRMLGMFFTNWDVEEMSIGDCLMGNKGLKVFLEYASLKRPAPRLHGSIRHKKRRFVLDLSSNDIGQEGIDDLVMFFKVHDIDILSIQGNEYEDCSELQQLLLKKGGKLIHDYEENGSRIMETEASLIQKFEAVL